MNTKYYILFAVALLIGFTSCGVEDFKLPEKAKGPKYEVKFDVNQFTEEIVGEKKTASELPMNRVQYVLRKITTQGGQIDYNTVVNSKSIDVEAGQTSIALTDFVEAGKYRAIFIGGSEKRVFTGDRTLTGNPFWGVDANSATGYLSNYSEALWGKYIDFEVTAEQAKAGITNQVKLERRVGKVEIVLKDAKAEYFPAGVNSITPFLIGNNCMMFSAIDFSTTNLAVDHNYYKLLLRGWSESCTITKTYVQKMNDEGIYTLTIPMYFMADDAGTSGASLHIGSDLEFMKEALTTSKFTKYIGSVNVPRNKILRYEGYLFTKESDKVEVGISNEPWESQIIELNFDEL